MNGLLPVDRLFDGVNDILFFVKDDKGRYIAANDTLIERCGKQSKEEILGKRADEVYPAPLGEEFFAQDAEIIKSGEGIRDRLELHLYPGGRRGWCLTFKEPVRGADGNVIGICGISRDLHQPGAVNEKYAAMSKALAHIVKHFDEPLRLPALAEMAGLSVYQFDQRIRQLFHVTAGQYLVRVRIDAACKRLTGGTEPIAQVALDCGYSDQSAFSRPFKQVVGMSPLAYRKKYTEA
ncbi:MAG: AraC family transcriptional regulator [Verrucomicrobiota bacterium]